MTVVATVRWMIRWKLNELMARHRISNKDLAESLGRHETSVSRMRTSDEMPRFNGESLNALCDALTGLAEVTVNPSDLIEYIPTEGGGSE